MSKTESTYLKGWAVLFMMFLHFGNTFIAPEYRYPWSGNEWEGAFQICVPIFLFLSGYGLMASYIGKGGNTVSLFCKEATRSVKLLKHYWVVTAPFIILALYTGKFSWSWESLIFTATTLRCDWCPNAWFVSLYIELILMFPLFLLLLKKQRTSIVGAGFILIVIATKLIGKVEWVDGSASIIARQVKMMMNNLPIFLEGMLFAKYDLIASLISRVERLKQYGNLFGGGLSIILVIAAIACRAKLPLVSITELIHVPMCLLGLLILAKLMKGIFHNMLFVGKYSTTLWFIHGYFCWTFCQSIIYSIRFWPLAFAVFVLISLLASVVVDKLRLHL